MEKMLGRTYKDTIKKDLKNKIKDNENFFIAHYKGLKSSEITQLRKELKKIGANMSVVRNRLTKFVLDDIKLEDEDILNSVQGPTAFIFSSDDPIVISKSLMHFSKEHTNLDVELAFIDKKLLDKNSIKELSALPSREILIARVISGIKAPLNGLHNVLSGSLKKVALVLKALSEKRAEEKPVKVEDKEQPKDEGIKQEEKQGDPEQQKFEDTGKDNLQKE